MNFKATICQLHDYITCMGREKTYFFALLSPAFVHLPKRPFPNEGKNMIILHAGHALAV
jgi:hypothetical protein